MIQIGNCRQVKQAKVETIAVPNPFNQTPFSRRKRVSAQISNSFARHEG
jgi:hypothetical protein